MQRGLRVEESIDIITANSRVRKWKNAQSETLSKLAEL